MTVKSGYFPDILKHANITPVFKVIRQTKVTTDLLVNTLFNFSKIFEKLIYTQISSFIEPSFLKYPPGFRKIHNTQGTLLKIIKCVAIC